MRRAALWGTTMAAAAALAVASAQAVEPAVGPPPDPGVAGIPHCNVPHVRKLPLAVAEKRLTKALCDVGVVTRKRSKVKRGRVVSAFPTAGSQLAAGTGVDLVVSLGRR
jgi:hypothetical protein